MAAQPLSGGRAPLLSAVIDSAANKATSIRKHKASKLGVAVRKAAAKVAGLGGTATGLSAFCVAAYQVGTIAGWITVGVSALVLDWQARK